MMSIRKCIVRRGGKATGEAELRMEIANFTFSDPILFMDVEADWRGSKQHRLCFYRQPRWGENNGYYCRNERGFLGYIRISDEDFHRHFVTTANVAGQDCVAWCDLHCVVPVWGEENAKDYELLESFEVPIIETDQQRWIMSLE